jgi:hypothetical protein
MGLKKVGRPSACRGDNAERSRRANDDGESPEPDYNTFLVTTRKADPQQESGSRQSARAKRMLWEAAQEEAKVWGSNENFAHGITVAGLHLRGLVQSVFSSWDTFDRTQRVKCVQALTDLLGAIINGLAD